ncbi:MAG: UDP-N-acetylmuramate:L-alanyl-gamma-D-glutamyl-meso-diaminopimelate ligase, partial [Proteobacteria bacterium]|nr:UDP-N-acetylmuramate:L-alanyl-gamma-D-glutamyl-meso-diaminopimelate ligase [Pseudomonadota bacterium]
LAMASKHRVVVSGTHGKTTTTSLASALLHATGRDPSFLVGGVSLDFEASFREGKGEHFVVEGDEYDTAFFDKTPKFLHYHPDTLILTSVEFDHADIYRDLEHVKSAFRQLISAMPKDGTIVAATRHPDVAEVVADAPCSVVRYGILDSGEDADLECCARALRSGVEGTSFELCVPGEAAVPVQSPLHGRFNAENALGALAALQVLGVPLAESVAALADFRGVRRRQEIRGEVGGVTVVDDFAHHPTAVRGTVEAMRERFPGRRLWAVFEPRTNTSRRAVFQADYALAFDRADRVLVREVPDGPLYSATGEVTERFSAGQLVADLVHRDLDARAFPDVERIVEHLAHGTDAGDVVLVMSNGSFDGIFERLFTALGKRESG